MDKLDGKISEDFWARKSDEWRTEEQRICSEPLALEHLKPERMLDGVRILELAHKAHFLYLKQTPEAQAKLLKIVVLNCSIDEKSDYPTYRKPFDLIFKHGKTKDGAPGGIRTPDPLLRRQTLFPTELRARRRDCPHCKRDVPEMETTKHDPRCLIALARPYT
jgi:hypothetical protein